MDLPVLSITISPRVLKMWKASLLVIVLQLLNSSWCTPDPMDGVVGLLHIELKLVSLVKLYGSYILNQNTYRVHYDCLRVRFEGRSQIPELQIRPINNLSLNYYQSTKIVRQGVSDLYYITGHIVNDRNRANNLRLLEETVTIYILDNCVLIERIVKEAIYGYFLLRTVDSYTELSLNDSLSADEACLQAASAIVSKEALIILIANRNIYQSNCTSYNPYKSVETVYYSTKKREGDAFDRVDSKATTSGLICWLAILIQLCCVLLALCNLMV